VGVPFVDLKAQYRSIKDEVHAAIDDVIQNTAFVLGPAVEKFEQDFATYLGAEHVVGVNTGTAALHLGLLALGVGPGDEVIVPAHTFIATAEAVSHVGARPVFVDVQEATGNMDPALLEQAITPRTRAIIPVHLYGQPADLEEIMAIAEARRIPLVEDACQAHGAAYRGRRVGTFGAIGCFSFYPGKNLGAYGEGGAVSTDDPEIAERIRRLRDHGQSARYQHAEVGYNARMEGIQGAVLGVKLRHLDRWNAARRQHAEFYDEKLAPLGLEIPGRAPSRESVHHLYVVRTQAREPLREHLSARGVQTGLHYPTPLHLQEAYVSLGHKAGAFPRSERWASLGMSLPMYPELAQSMLQEVVEGIASFSPQTVR
jgi:dTDP-4-amino-4,6-dideoxygalactose transaminase